MQESNDFDALWDYSNPAATESRFRELLGTLSGERDLELRTQIARALGLQGRFQEAHALLDEVDAALEPGYAAARVRYLLERGRVLNSSGNPEAARPLFVQAWDDARAAGLDGYAVDAAHMVAIVEAPERKAEWTGKALALAESSEDPRARRWLGSLYNNIGWDLHDQGRYEEAVDAHWKAWEWHRVHGTAESERIARWSVAKDLRMLGELDEALEMQRALAGEREKDGAPDGFVFEEIGECLLAKGERKEARGWFGKAHALLKDVGWIEAGRLARMKRLSEGLPG